MMGGDINVESKPAKGPPSASMCCWLRYSKDICKITRSRMRPFRLACIDRRRHAGEPGNILPISECLENAAMFAPLPKEALEKLKSATRKKTLTVLYWSITGSKPPMERNWPNGSKSGASARYNLAHDNCTCPDCQQQFLLEERTASRDVKPIYPDQLKAALRSYGPRDGENPPLADASPYRKYDGSETGGTQPFARICSPLIFASLSRKT